MQFSFSLATLELRLDICSFGDHQRDETQPSPLKLLVPYNHQEGLQLVITALKWICYICFASARLCRHQKKLQQQQQQYKERSQGHQQQCMPFVSSSL